MHRHGHVLGNAHALHEHDVHDGRVRDSSTDVCVGISSEASFKAYRYVGATPTMTSCQAAAPGAAQNVALTGEQTICCAP